MDAEKFRKHGKEMIDFIADHIEGVRSRRAVPNVKPGFLIKDLPKEAPDEGEDWQDIMDDVTKRIVPGVSNWQHPQFHAYFPAGNSYPSILGEMLESSFGAIGFSWASSPACTELEMVVTDWLGKAMGLPDAFLHSGGSGGGVIQGSASESVLVSMLAARKQAFSRHRLTSGSRLVAYCSTLAHSCVEKAASICNIRLRQIPADPKSFSMKGSALKAAIEEDLEANWIPFYVCATLGTTSVCSFDDLESISTELQTIPLNIWLHVDCAYAGNALICPEFQHLLQEGIEAVSSLEFNANKWMLTNFDCSCMWVRDRDAVEQTLCVDPLYLKHAHQQTSTDFRNWGIPLSRRFRSLKLWFVIRSYGIHGLQAYIREHIRLAKLFTKLLSTDNRFEQVGESRMGLVVFRLKGENELNERLLSVINTSTDLFMVPAKVNDKYVIRFCVCSPVAKDSDMTHAWKAISSSADDVLTEKFIEMTLEPNDLSPADLAINCFSFPSHVKFIPDMISFQKQRQIRRYSSIDKEKSSARTYQNRN